MTNRPIPPATDYPQPLNVEFNAIFDRLDGAKTLPLDERVAVMDDIIRNLLVKQYEYIRYAHYDAIDTSSSADLLMAPN